VKALASLLSGLSFLLVAACSESPDETAETFPPPSPLLYEIANASGEVQGWLFGTIHALPDGAEWRTPAIERVTQDADILLVEVADLENTSEISGIFARLSNTRGLGPLKNRVSLELRGDVSEMIDRSNIDPASFSSTEDWAAAIMLAQVDAPGRPSNGVDRAVIRDFASRPVYGFETAEAQLRIFDTLPPQDQRDLLEGTVREWAEAKNKRGRLVRSWITGDIAALEEATTSGIMADAELRNALLVDRNERWLPVLLDVLESDDRPLVAVGTAHIVGPDGLQAMLTDQGYAVRRLE
jgi:uncharacterized protein YbaP (TraB family)